MKIEIWSDVICPYCFIGKRKLEKAMQAFDYSDEVDIEWKSFQLQPDAETQPDKNVTEHLAEVKGWSIEQADQMNRHVTDMAAEENIEFNLDKAVVANSFNAHRLIHFAKTHDKGDETKEALLKAYFTEGKNIDSAETLIELAGSVGLNPNKTEKVLGSNRFANAVKQDVQAAKNMGIRGVPFFLFDRKYAISGAQKASVFKRGLQKLWQESNGTKQASNEEIEEGAACTPEDNC